MAGASRATASSDWLLHPSLVFKTFEDNLIKSPFSYGNTPHIVPEKILESFVDQNGLRCYRVKWLDSWLTEQHVTAAFPHLITEYWINKPINSNVDYQNYIVQNRALPNLQIPVTTSNVSAPNTKAGSPQTSKGQESVDENIQQISQAPTTVTISQLFSNETNKDVGIPCTGSDTVVENDDSESVVTGGDTDFNVSDGLQLPENVTEGSSAEQGGEELKSDEKFPTEEPLALSNDVAAVPKISENSMVFLFDKNGSYTVAESNMSESKESPINKVSHIAQFNHPFKTQLNNFVGPSAIRLPSMTLEQISQLPRPIPSIVQAEVNNSEEKVSIKRSPNIQAKAASSKDKIPVVCDICGKTISSRKNLRVHKTVKHFKNGSFACQICGRKFALNRDLKRHMPLHTNERKYQCGHCGLQCKQPGHLTKHIRTHTEVMNWRCDCCFKNFRVQADLKQHCFTEHADIHKENLTCSVCKEKLKLPNSVYLHSLRHSGVREFQCEICKASFKLKQHMQVHMKTHSKPKDIALITCQICQREFKFKHTFRKHFSKHLEKTKEEYDENARLRQEEKKRKLEEKRSPDVRLKRRRSKEVESHHSASDGEESKNLPKRKQRRPERVCFDRELNKNKNLVRDEIKPLSCIDCELTFTTQALFKSHMKLHKLDNSLNKTVFPSPIPIIRGKQTDPTISNESQMVMLKLPDPVIDNNTESNNLSDVNNVNNTESNIEMNNTISQQISDAIAMSTLTGFQEKESIAIGGLSDDSKTRDEH